MLCSRKKSTKQHNEALNSGTTVKLHKLVKRDITIAIDKTISSEIKNCPNIITPLRMPSEASNLNKTTQNIKSITKEEMQKLGKIKKEKKNLINNKKVKIFVA